MEKQKKKKQKSRKEKEQKSRRERKQKRKEAEAEEQKRATPHPLKKASKIPRLDFPYFFPPRCLFFLPVPPLSSGCLFFPPRCLPFLPDTDCFSSADSLRCRSIYWCKSRKSKLCWQENYFFTKRKLSYRQQAYYSAGWSNRGGCRFSPSAPRVKPFKMLI